MTKPYSRGKGTRDRSREVQPKKDESQPWKWGRSEERVVWIVSMGLTLAVVYLNWLNFRSAGPLWRDEAAFMNVATKTSWSAVWHSFHFEAFPLAPFALMRSWCGLGLGGTDQGLRATGLIVGLLILGVLWLKGYLFKTGPPLLSLALLGFSPLFIQWSDSLRGYGIGTCLMLLTFALMWKVVETGAARWAIPTLIAAILSVQCLYFNAFLLSAVALAAILVCLRRRCWRSSLLVVGLWAAACVSLLPYLGPIQEVRTWSIVIQGRFTPDLFRRTVTIALNGLTGFMAWVWFGLTALALCAAAFAQGRHPASHLHAPRRDLLLYAGLILVLGGVACYAFLARLDYVPEPWYYVPIMALAAVTVGTIGTSAASPKYLGRLPQAAVACGIAGLCWASTQAGVQERHTNMDRVVSELERTADPGDLILINPWHFAPSFCRYYHGQTPWMTVPPMGDVSVHRYDLMKQIMTQKDPLRPVLDKAEQTLRSGHRVWVVGALMRLNPEGPPGQLPPAPFSTFRWAAGPYMIHWSWDLSYALSVLTERRGQLQMDDLPVSEFERVAVFVYEPPKR